MRFFIPWLLLWLVGGPSLHAAGPNVVVQAGDAPLRHATLSFRPPPGYADAVYLLGPENARRPLQRAADGTLTFVEPRLGPATTRTYALVREAPPPPRVRIERGDTALRMVPPGGAPPLTYQSRGGPVPDPAIPEVYQRGGYLHPILSPSRRLVSDDYPRQHLHHHGLWFAWTKTEFQGRHPDFWNMGKETGTVVFDQLLDTWEGPVHAGFQARHLFQDLTPTEPVTVLREQWTVRYYAPLSLGRPMLVFDIESRQACATDDPLLLPRHRYGGIGFRGHGDWNGAPNCDFLTSKGITDRVKGHATRGRWCYVGGKVEGRQTGILFLGHPGNFRAPQTMRLHPNEPFFNFAPQQLGDMKIEPGRPYLSRYRCVVVDGPPDQALFEECYNAYASPPMVRVIP